MSIPVTSPVVVDDTSGNPTDNQRLLDDVEKQLYQRTVAKLHLEACPVFHKITQERRKEHEKSCKVHTQTP